MKGESVFDKSRKSSLSSYGESFLKQISVEEMKKIVADISQSQILSKDGKKAKKSNIQEKSSFELPMWLKKWIAQEDNMTKKNSLGSATAKSESSKGGIKASDFVDGMYNVKYNNNRRRGALSSDTNESLMYPDADRKNSSLITNPTNPDSHKSNKPIDLDQASLTISYPTKLSISKTDEELSFIKYNPLLMSSSLAHYNCAIDNCYMCGSSGFNEPFVFCSCCGEGFHIFCVFPNDYNIRALRQDWRCMNCSSCEECDDKYENIRDSDGYVYCDNCDRVYHLKCVDPPLSSVPAGLWYCKVRLCNIMFFYLIKCRLVYIVKVAVLGLVRIIF